MHDLGIAHGNLKMSNIVIRDIGGKKMLRIGDCQICSIDLFQMKQKYGMKQGDTTSFNYYSPELLSNKANKLITLQSDMWALGVILYYMATYRFPFDAYSEGGQALLIKGTYDDGPLGFSPLIKSIVSSLLVKDPNVRSSVYHIILNNMLQDNLY